MINNKKGFTLVELLVVIAIIGILSSVVFASLSNSRLKARDAAIRQEMVQFRNLLEQEFNDNDSYIALQRGWAPANACGSIGFSGTYAAQAVSLCNDIVAKV